MRINNNLMAMNTHRQLGMTNTAGSKSMEKLSSGFRINRAGDDAAGLSISEKMRAQIRGLNQASRNSQDGISLIQTAEGALNETQAILQRMRELAVQSSNDTNVAVDRGEIQKEINQLTSEINRIGNTTEFNTMKLLNGDKADVIDAIKATAKTYTKPSAGLSIEDGAIKLSTTGLSIDGTSNIASGATWTAATTGVITIQKNASGQLEVSINAETLSASSTVTITDKIDVEFTNGSYTYASHGVNFTISKEDFEAATEGKKITFDIEKEYGVAGGTAAGANGSFAAKVGQTWTGVAGLDATGIVIGANVDFEVARMEVKVEQGGTGVSVKLFDVDGNELISDVVKNGLSGTTITYDKHGVSFTMTGIASNAGSSFSVDFEYSYTEKQKGDSVTFQVGANENQSMSLSLSDMRSKALGISTTIADSEGFGASKAVTDGTSSTNAEYALDVTTSANASRALTTINSAIETVSSERSKLGAIQNRLEHTIKNLDTSSENLQASESRIRDVDMAKEMMEFTKNNILQQAAQAMLAQANQAPQGVLQLLR